MKKSFLLLVCLLLVWNLSAREVVNINRGWKFFADTEASSDGSPVVNIPHTWNTDALGGKRDYFRGTGNYIKEIVIPREWYGKRIFIKGYGANSVCNIFVNGRMAGEHHGGYTAYAYEITDFVNFGRRNIFRIVVNNSPRTDVLPNAGDLNSYGGIIRDLELVATGRDLVSLSDNGSDGVYVVQKKVDVESVEAEVIAKVSGVRDNNVNVVMTLYDSGFNLLEEQTSKVKLTGRNISDVSFPLTIPEPRLWDGREDPYLYSIAVKVYNDNKLSDSILVRTGFRSLTIDERGGLMLNGKPFHARGVVVHHDRPIYGSAIEPFHVEEDFQIISEMGANLVRTASVLHHPDFYRLCEENGVLVWCDFPVVGPVYLTDRGFINSEGYKNGALRQSVEIIRQLYNNPAVVMWGIFSDLRSRGDNPSGFITDLNAAARLEDPSRLTVASSNDDGQINFITDLIVWDHHFGWKEGLPSDIEIWKRQYFANWRNLRSAVSYSAGGSIRHQEDSLKRPNFIGNWHPERWQTHLHEEYLERVGTDPHFWGVVVGNLFDYGASGRSWGEGYGINDHGLVTFDRKIKKDAFYLYKARWNDTEPFVYLAEKRWNSRSDNTQTIKVYSNCGEVDLWINGVYYGGTTGLNGILLWNNIVLPSGPNVIEARSGRRSDRMVVRIEKNKFL